MKLLRKPDALYLQLEGQPAAPTTGGGTDCIERDGQLDIFLESDHPVSRIGLRWKNSLPDGARILGDAWQRAYDDLEWRGVVPDRIMPKYFAIHADGKTVAAGMAAPSAAFGFWQVDETDIWLWLDVRNGGKGIQLNGRRLHVTSVVQAESTESAFSALRDLCRKMCPTPRLPASPVFGGNDWYHAYGSNTAEGILNEAELIKKWSADAACNPFMVIDGGWQASATANGPIGGGPWTQSNERFPDLPGLAAKIKALGVRPGIWIRPMAAPENTPKEFLLPESRADSSNDRYTRTLTYDPSIPEALNTIEEEVRTIRSWGFDLLKHDFSSIDILGKWGQSFERGLAAPGWHFADRTRTTSEIIREFYSALRRGMGDGLIIGCDTFLHLGAGLFEIQRIGEDSNDVNWRQTRLHGINGLAFRMPQHGIMHSIDADCVGITQDAPWELNRRWMDLISKSGTPLFISADPAAVGPEQEAAIRAAFARASRPQPPAEPLTWMDSTSPRRWKTAEGVETFDWADHSGRSVFKGFFATQEIQ
jgi:alpha-galactosidase